LRRMIVSVVVGFLNVSNVSWLSVLVIVMSRKFSFLSFSCSNVNFRSGVMVLNKLMNFFYVGAVFVVYYKYVFNVFVISFYF